MRRRIAAVTLLVPSYDEGIAFFTSVLGFDLLEDTPLTGGKRWVRVAPPGGETALLLAEPKNEAERAAMGAQTGGRVGFFLNTDDFDRDHGLFIANGLAFKEPPRHEPYGVVAVFSDPWGNLWDLIEPAEAHI